RLSLFFFPASAAPRDLRSFPTRRSSDLPHPRQCSVAARANSSFRWSLSSVIVPTVEREVLTGLVWSIAIAGGTPSMRSTCGLSRSEEHTSELQSRENLVCRLLLEKKKTD